MKTIIVSLLLMSLATVAVADVPTSPHEVRPLLVAAEIPEATLVGTDGQPRQLVDILDGKPAVLVFYRGGW